MKTLFIGHNKIHLNTINSTNSYAIDLLKENAPVEGTIISTFNQTNGRGQRGNEWVGEPNKNVAFSIILYPNFLSIESQFLLTKITSLAASDLMAELLKNTYKKHKIKIKWPNDIYVNNRKIAGILIENSLKKSNIQNSVIGIGINVNQVDFSTSIKNPISLKLLLKENLGLNLCIEKFCEYFEARYLQLKTNKIEKLHQEYFDRLYLLNEWHIFNVNGEKVKAKIVGVSNLGKLKLELETKQIEEFNLKEIVF